MTLNPLFVVSESSFESPIAHNVVLANVYVVNYVRKHALSTDLLHPDAIISYCLDFYERECSHNGFASFVYRSAWLASTVQAVEEGLAAIGAAPQLQWYKEQRAAVDALSPEVRSAFLRSENWEQHPLTQQLNAAMETCGLLYHVVQEKHITWLKKHAALSVLPNDQFNAFLEQLKSNAARKATTAKAQSTAMPNAPDLEARSPIKTTVSRLHNNRFATQLYFRQLHKEQSILALIFFAAAGGITYWGMVDDGEVRKIIGVIFLLSSIAALLLIRKKNLPHLQWLQKHGGQTFVCLGNHQELATVLATEFLPFVQVELKRIELRSAPGYAPEQATIRGMPKAIFVAILDHYKLEWHEPFALHVYKNKVHALPLTELLHWYKGTVNVAEVAYRIECMWQNA